MSVTAARLESLLAAVPPKLSAIRDAEASRKSDGRWSKKEILGHLIDSASNNHQRFVRAQLAPHLDYPRYEQNQWVATQRYAEEPWPDLVNLWLLYNRHLGHVMRTTPPGSLAHTISIGGADPMTLGALMEDYLRHLEHHLEQLVGQALSPAGV